MKKAKRILCAALSAVQLAGVFSLGVTASAANTVSSVDTIAAGENHSLVIKSDMSLWTSGSNAKGQLGIGTGVSESEGQKILNNIVFAEANDDVSFAIDVNGTLYGWGDNSMGQVSPASSDINIYKPTKLMDNVVSVSAGDDHTVAITSDGAAYGWGCNAEGELGYSVNAKRNPSAKLMDNVTDAAAGDGFTLLVTSDGKVYASGNNDNGQLGMGNRRNYAAFTQVPVSDVEAAEAGNDHSLLLMSNGTVFASGLNDKGQITAARSYISTFGSVGVANASAIFAGGDSSAAVTDNGRLYVWGANESGQLQNSKSEDVRTPVAAVSGVISVAFGESHSLVLKTGGTVSAVGVGTHGQLFKYSDSAVAKPESIMRDVRVYSAGIDHAAAIDEDGNLYTWGANDCGQLGLGDYINRNKPQKVAVSNAVNVWCGDKCTIVQTSDDRVVVFGDNTNYKLGMDTDGENVSSPQTNYYLSDYTIDDIQFGAGFCLALISGDIYGWGRNASGQLGDLSKTVSIPDIIFTDITGVTNIAAGDYHCLAIDSAGELYVWGSNSSNVLGGDFEDRYLSYPETIELIDQRTELDYAAVDISAAGNYSMAVGSNDRVWVWGGNAYGQLAVSNTQVKTPYMLIDDASQISAGKYASAIVTYNGDLYLAGSNRFGALGDGYAEDKSIYIKATGTDVTAVDLGDYFGGYIRDDGVLFCWGDNSLGQVGNGKGGASFKPETVMTGALVKELVGAEGISLDKTELIVKPNGTAKLTATITPEDAVQTVRWSSSNTSIATVSANGTVRGVKNGTAVITATAANGVSASCKVTVTIPVSSFSVSPSKTKTLKIGQSFTFTSKIYPSTAIDKTLLFESSDPEVAKVSSKGKVTAVSTGTAKITVTAKSNPEKTRTVTIYVRPAKMKFSSRKATADGVVFKWEENEEADGYTIYRRTSQNGTSYVLANIEDATSYVDTSAKAGKTYYYIIKAYIEVDGKKIYSPTSSLYKIKAK